MANILLLSHEILTLPDEDVITHLVAHRSGKLSGKAICKSPVANKVIGRDHIRNFEVGREYPNKGPGSIDG